MNALDRLSVLTNKPRIDGESFIELGNGFSIRCEYRITQHGRPNSRAFSPGDPDADGVPYEVTIIDAFLITNSEGTSIKLNSLHPWEMFYIEEERIAKELDEAQS